MDRIEGFSTAFVRLRAVNEFAVIVRTLNCDRLDIALLGLIWVSYDSSLNVMIGSRL